MMSKIVVSLVAMMSLMVAGGNVTTVVAEVEPLVETSKVYVGVGGGVQEIEEFYDYAKGDVDDYDKYVGVVLAGYNINEYVGVEGRYTFSDFDYTTAGLYGVARYENETIVTPYVGVGYAWSEYPGDVEVDGVSYILGANVKTPYEGVSVFADITYNKEPDEHVALVGVKYGF